MKKLTILLSLFLMLSGCATTNNESIKKAELQQDETVETTTIKRYEPETKKEEFYAFAFGGANTFSFDVNVEDGLKKGILKLYQYNNGTWEYHGGNEIEISNNELWITGSYGNMNDLRLAMQSKRRMGSTTLDPIENHFVPDEQGGASSDVEKISDREIDTSKEEPIFAYRLYNQDNPKQALFKHFEDISTLETDGNELYLMWTLSFE